MTTEKKIRWINDAIDTLIDLEGTVYPNGLPPEMEKSLDNLRSKRAALEKEEEVSNG
jgi:hypothetical protein